MPVPWVVMNSVSGVMAGSLGIVQFAVGVSASGGSIDKRQVRPILIAAGVVDMLGATIVIAASHALRKRPTHSFGDISVLPMAASNPRNPVTGVVVAGRF